MKQFLAGVFLFGCCWNVGAQGSKCEETLSQATEQFSAGHFFEIPGILKACIERDDFTNEQQVRAYLLLTQVYLILDNPKEAEGSYLKLLRANPEYVASEEKDPIDVVYLSKKFTSRPVFTPQVRLGLNTALFRDVFSDADSQTPSSTRVNTRHSLRVGVQFGAGFDFNINNNWSLCAEGNFASQRFKIDWKNFLTPNDDETITEKRFALNIPVYLKFATDKGRIRPFGYAGGAAQFLLSSKGDLVFNNRTGSVLLPSTGPSVDLLYQRKKIGWSFVLGGGLKYKIGKDYVYADLRYNAGLTNLTLNNNYATKNPAPVQNGKSTIESQLNPAATFDRFVSPYFRLDNLSLSFGYIRPIYNPRKIRQMRLARIFHLFDKKNDSK